MFLFKGLLSGKKIMTPSTGKVLRFRTMMIGKYCSLITLLVFVASCGGGVEEARRELRTLGVSFTEKAFIETATKGDIVAVELFLEAGMNPDVRNSSDRTALIQAAQEGYTLVVKALLEADADVNAKDKMGESALLRAAYLGNNSVVESLLSSPDLIIDQYSNAGTTALMVAASFGHYQTVRLLLENGASVHFTDNKNETALDKALGLETLSEDYAKIVRLLREAGGREGAGGY